MKIWVDGSTTKTCHIFDDAVGSIYIRDLAQKATVNEGEYYAIIYALQDARCRGITDVDILSDSQVVVNQLNADYQIRAPHLLQLAVKVLDLARRFNRVTYSWIPREENKAGQVLENERRR